MQQARSVKAESIWKRRRISDFRPRLWHFVGIVQRSDLLQPARIRKPDLSGRYAAAGLLYYCREKIRDAVEGLRISVRKAVRKSVSEEWRSYEHTGYCWTCDGRTIQLSHGGGGADRSDGGKAFGRTDRECKDRAARLFSGNRARTWNRPRDCGGTVGVGSGRPTDSGKLRRSKKGRAFVFL